MKKETILPARPHATLMKAVIRQLSKHTNISSALRHLLRAAPSVKEILKIRAIIDGILFNLIN